MPNWQHAGRDVTNCSKDYNSGRLQRWSMSQARTVTCCDAIDFGTDSRDFALDGECDEIRLEGRAAAMSMEGKHIRADASDRAHMRGFGVVALRDY